jgi:hypothetical protein
VSDAPGALPERQSYAALAAQVADLRSTVTAWDARLQTLGLDGSLNLTAKLAELAELVEEEVTSAAAPYWLDYSDEEYAEALSELAEWVSGVLLPNYEPPEVRPCWANHPHAVWELSTLAAEWRRIYDRKLPLLGPALTWHDRWLPDVCRRLASVMKDCTAERCAKGALPNPDRRSDHG